ncbi:hypothetical protein D6789_00195 [Candidatus Woesearchaeota archaeon]|nr:MAG: hypothetical protein D6789_00195 [Candidatus Woesearchaeota archaeon]
MVVRVRQGQLLLAGLLLFVALSSADSIDLTSGSVYSAILETRGLSPNWAGLIIVDNGTNGQVDTTPFVSMTLNTPTIIEAPFPGTNLKNDLYYYAAMVPSYTINTNNIQNMTPKDLLVNELFNSTEYPIFYPYYENLTDNPNGTFCCVEANITIAGKNFTAYKAILNQSIPYYLLKYNVSNTTTPLFLVDIADATCYNGTSCIGVFMLPVNTNAYNFYILPQTTTYNITTWIDGVETRTFSQTARPYNLTVLVKDLFSGVPQTGKDVAVYEQGGQNLFIPLELSGIVNTAWSIGQTDGSGMEEWLVAPTAYPEVVNYTIGVAVVESDQLVSPITLSITTYDSLPSSSKTVTPSELRDDAVAAVNAMNQIVNFLFEWASNREEGKRFRYDYETTTGTWTTYIYVSPLGYVASPATLKSGAPNQVEVRLLTSGTPQTGSVRARERNGFLILNPRTGSTPLSAKSRAHYQTIPTGTQFIITPTSYSFVTSNITFDLYNQGGTLLDTLTININNSLNIQGGGASLSDDDLKATVNQMNGIINSLYLALNT